MAGVAARAGVAVEVCGGEGCGEAVGGTGALSTQPPSVKAHRGEVDAACVVFCCGTA